MSGGEYCHAHAHIDQLAEDIVEQGECSAASPGLRIAFKAHLRLVALAARAVEWNDSGDGCDREAELIRAVCGPAAEVSMASETREADLRRKVAELEERIQNMVTVEMGT